MDYNELKRTSIMARLFNSYVIVDWSAASKPVEGTDSIWIGALAPNARNQLVFKSSNPPTRAKAEAEINELLTTYAKRGDRTLVGFDFPLGFPEGSAKALKLKNQTPWAETWDFITKGIRDKPDNTNNRFVLGARMNHVISGEAFPFWGCPPRDEVSTLKAKRYRQHEAGDLPEFRRAEVLAKGAQPVWKLYYNASVGGQALTGIPIAKRLREAPARIEKSLVWPFETGWKPLTDSDLDGVEVVYAEVFPSSLKPVVKPGEVKDEVQVRTMAEHFAQLDQAGKLGALFGPKTRPDYADIIEAEEGWILGVQP